MPVDNKWTTLWISCGQLRGYPQALSTGGDNLSEQESAIRANKNHNIRLCICPHCKADLQAGERMADAINMYRVNMPWDMVRDKWMAFRLADGTSDGILYESKRDAVRHQAHEMLCCYIAFVNLMGGAVAHQCAIFLNFTRDAYDAGFRLPDPDDVHGGPDVAPTAAQIDAVQGIIRPVLHANGSKRR